MPAGCLVCRHQGPAPSPQTWPESKTEKYQLFPRLLVALSCPLVSSACGLLSLHLRSSGISAPAPKSFSPSLAKEAEACCLRKYSTYSQECSKEGVTGWKAASCCLVSVYVPPLALLCPRQGTAPLPAALVCSSRCSSGQRGSFGHWFPANIWALFESVWLHLDRISV